MNKLNIRSKTMLATSHSWSCVMRHLLSEFQNQGHKLYLTSTNGTELIPNSLKKRLDRDIKVPDIDLCYTVPRNFQERFEKKSKLKLAIYNYETDKFPSSWLKEAKYVDYILPSSYFSKQIFIEAGWPEKKCIVIPHGINLQDFKISTMYPLQTKKSFKFLNISIPHYRKNIDLVLESYYEAFSNQDDVCLVLKTSFKKPKYKFEVDLSTLILNVQKKYQNKAGGLPEVEIVQEHVENIIPLYNSCHVLISASSTEGFGLPLLEALAANKIVIAPKCTGQLDFLNIENSLLVNVKEIEADEKLQYWTVTPGAKTYFPIKDDLIQAMNRAYNDKTLSEKFQSERLKTIENFTWTKAAQKILDLQ